MTDRSMFQRSYSGNSGAQAGEIGFEYRLIAHNSTCDVGDELRKQLNLICNLEADWDGYGSPPVKFECAEMAMRIVTTILTLFENSRPPLQGLNPGLPYFVPVSGGALQIEWHLQGSKFIELFLDGGEECTASYIDDINNEEREIQIRCAGPQIDLTILPQWIVDAKRSGGEQDVAA